MNKIIQKYFDDIEIELINSPIVESYNILRQETFETNGKIRIKIHLTNKSEVDVFEYMEELENSLITKKYHFHWQDSNKNMVLRWDNAPHHKELKNFPHHLHTFSGVEAIDFEPNILVILQEIEKKFDFFAKKTKTLTVNG